MKSFQSILGCLLLGVVFGCASTPEFPSDYVPLPRNLEIVSPAPSLPNDIKGFSGKWKGSWNETLPHILAVEQITPPDVIAVYAVGKFTSGRGEAVWHRVRGTVKPGILKLFLKTSIATYRLQSDGSLTAINEGGDTIALAKMKRIE
jgi:hypothetical protein